MKGNTPRAYVTLRYGICSVAAGAKEVLRLEREIKQKPLDVD